MLANHNKDIPSRESFLSTAPPAFTVQLKITPSFIKQEQRFYQCKLQ